MSTQLVDEGARSLEPERVKVQRDTEVRQAIADVAMLLNENASIGR